METHASTFLLGFRRKLKEWHNRDWASWLEEHLAFPFMVERIDDDFLDETDPFSAGHMMKAVGIDGNDDKYGIILKIRVGRKVGYIPLVDVEVVGAGKNKQVAEEYLAWFSYRV